MSDYNYEAQMMGGELQGSTEFMGIQMGGGNKTNDNYYKSKNPSTAAGSYLQGIGGGYAGAGLTSVGGIGMGQMATESFDLDIMMPPDIASIDSDISKKIAVIKYLYR